MAREDLHGLIRTLIVKHVREVVHTERERMNRTLCELTLTLKASGTLRRALRLGAPASLCAACFCSFCLRSASVCVRVSMTEKAESIPPITFPTPDALLPSMAPERAQREEERGGQGGRDTCLSLCQRAPHTANRWRPSAWPKRGRHGARRTEHSCPRLGCKAHSIPASIVEGSMLGGGCSPGRWARLVSADVAQGYPPSRPFLTHELFYYHGPVTEMNEQQPLRSRFRRLPRRAAAAVSRMSLTAVFCLCLAALMPLAPLPAYGSRVAVRSACHPSGPGALRLRGAGAGARAKSSSLVYAQKDSAACMGATVKIMRSRKKRDASASRSLLSGSDEEAAAAVLEALTKLAKLANTRTAGSSQHTGAAQREDWWEHPNASRAEVLAYLRTRDPTAPDDAEERPGYTEELASAASRGRVRRIRELVAQGAQVNSAGADMWAPLHHATRHSHPRAVGALLDAGARVNISTWGRWTPLHLAATVGDGAIARMLLEVRMSGALNCSSAHTCEHTCTRPTASNPWPVRKLKN